MVFETLAGDERGSSTRDTCEDVRSVFVMYMYVSGGVSV